MNIDDRILLDGKLGTLRGIDDGNLCYIELDNGDSHSSIPMDQLLPSNRDETVVMATAPQWAWNILLASLRATIVMQRVGSLSVDDISLDQLKDAEKALQFKGGKA